MDLYGFVSELRGLFGIDNDVLIMAAMYGYTMGYSDGEEALRARIDEQVLSKAEERLRR